MDLAELCEKLLVAPDGALGGQFGISLAVALGLLICVLLRASRAQHPEAPSPPPREEDTLQ